MNSFIMLGTVVMDEISTPCPRSVVARGRQPGSEVRGGDPEEPPMPEARTGGWEEQPEEGWLRRHRRA